MRRLLALIFLAVPFSLDCGRPTGVPDPAPSNTQKLPFDGQAGVTGRSPTDSLVPTAIRIPEGTPITVHLTESLSSAIAHPGDGFEAKLDEPIVVDNQLLIPIGTSAQGRILATRRGSGPRDAGYLRIALVQIESREKTIRIETSAVFTKGNEYAPSGLSPSDQTTSTNDAVFQRDRRLTFRLTQAVDLQ